MSSTIDAGDAATGQHRDQATAGQPLGQRQLLAVVGALMLVVLLAALDQTIVSTALPKIVGDLHGLTDLQWVITAYLLASTIVLPIYGKLGDLIGRKWLFQLAIVIFLVGSALSGASQNITQLIIFRALQGVGGGGLMIGAQAIIGDMVSPRERGKYQGLIGGAFGVASVAGPLLGGFLTDLGQGTWRYCFYINIPLGVIAMIVTAVVLKLPRRKATFKLDYFGAALLAGFSTCIVLITSWGGTKYAWDSGQIIGLGIGSVVLLALFIVAEALVKEPMLPLKLFKNSIFALTSVMGVALGVCMFGALSYVPTFLQMVDGKSATVSGLLMLPMIVGLLIASLGSGQLISRLGHYKTFPIVGTAILGVGLFLLSRLDQSNTILENSVFFLRGRHRPGHGDAHADPDGAEFGAIPRTRLGHLVFQLFPADRWLARRLAGGHLAGQPTGGQDPAVRAGRRTERARPVRASAGHQQPDTDAGPRRAAGGHWKWHRQGVQRRPATDFPLSRTDYRGSIRSFVLPQADPAAYRIAGRRAAGGRLDAPPRSARWPPPHRSVPRSVGCRRTGGTAARCRPNGHWWPWRPRMSRPRCYRYRPWPRMASCRTAVHPRTDSRRSRWRRSRWRPRRCTRTRPARPTAAYPCVAMSVAAGRGSRRFPARCSP